MFLKILTRLMVKVELLSLAIFSGKLIFMKAEPTR
jgi:hypothetical protein